MKIKDIMTPEVEVLSPTTSIQEAAAKMKELDVGSLPVCDGSRIIGMLTDRDITVRFVAAGLDFSGTTVSDVMTRDVVYCFEDDDVEKAEAVMKQHQIRRLIVLDAQKRLAGIVSLGDVAVEFGDKVQAGDVLKGVSQPSGTLGAAGAKAAGAAAATAASISRAAKSARGGKSGKRAKGGAIAGLVKDELSAVETYRQAIEKLGSNPAAEELRRIEQDHENAVAVLQQRAVELGMTPPSSSGAWGAWAKMVEGAASLFGEKPAIKALKEGEEHGINDYERCLEDPSTDETIKNLISTELLPRTRAHVETLDQYLGEGGGRGPSGMSYNANQGYGETGQGRGAA